MHQLYLNFTICMCISYIFIFLGNIFLFSLRILIFYIIVYEYLSYIYQIYYLWIINLFAHREKEREKRKLQITCYVYITTRTSYNIKKLLYVCLHFFRFNWKIISYILRCYIFTYTIWTSKCKNAFNTIYDIYISF